MREQIRRVQEIDDKEQYAEELNVKNEAEVCVRAVWLEVGEDGSDETCGEGHPGNRDLFTADTR